MQRPAVVVVGDDGGGLGRLRLATLLLLLLEEVLVAAEAGPGELALVLLAHLADLGEVHGVVRHGAVLDVPVPERRHGHPPNRRALLLLQAAERPDSDCCPAPMGSKYGREEGRNESQDLKKVRTRKSLSPGQEACSCSYLLAVLHER